MMPLGTDVNLGPGDVVADGVATAFPKRGTAPQFSVHCYYGQTAGWMKTPLVLDGDPAPPRKGHSCPPPRLFGRCLLWPRSPISATAELLLRYASGQADRQTDTVACVLRVTNDNTADLEENQNQTRNRKHRRAAAKPAACAPNAVDTREQGKEGGRVS